MPEQIVAETKDEAVALCVSHFRSYELLAYGYANTSEDTDRYANICNRLLVQYAELTGHNDLLVAHKSFTQIH